MASAAGLPLVPPDRRDPLHTTTRGVGELIADALERGCRNFLVGIGGSATNDGGAGMLAALGFGLLDTDGQPIPDGAAGLEQLCRIDTAGVRPELQNCRFRIACDVENPLCGPLAPVTSTASERRRPEGDPPAGCRHPAVCRTGRCRLPRL